MTVIELKVQESHEKGYYFYYDENWDMYTRGNYNYLLFIKIMKTLKMMLNKYLYLKQSRKKVRLKI